MPADQVLVFLVLATALVLLTGTVAVLSAFINNVGALALMMPVAIRQARKYKHPAPLLLMPMAFASLLGGLQTAIGTPPNLIVAEYRHSLGNPAFTLEGYMTEIRVPQDSPHAGLGWPIWKSAWARTC